MKTWFASLFAFFLVAVALAQAPLISPAEWLSLVSGSRLAVDCPNQKGNTWNYSWSDNEGVLQLKVALNNANAFPVDYSMDVFFLTESSSKISPKNRQSTNLVFLAGASSNITFSAPIYKSGKDRLVTNWSGFIVQLSSYGRQLKVVASSPALERLARDPEKMKLLESGKSVPLK